MDVPQPSTYSTGNGSLVLDTNDTTTTGNDVLYGLSTGVLSSVGTYINASDRIDYYGRIILSAGEAATTDKTELISTNGTFGAITNVFWGHGQFSFPSITSDGHQSQTGAVAAEPVEAEYIFDRLDVRIIFITLYSMVFACCFFGKCFVGD